MTEEGGKFYPVEGKYIQKFVKNDEAHWRWIKMTITCNNYEMMVIDTYGHMVKCEDHGQHEGSGEKEDRTTTGRAKSHAEDHEEEGSHN
jgi:hypothetical protein